MIDCDYAFAKTPGPLSEAVTEFQADLRKVAAAQAPIAERYGFPLLEPPADASPEEKQRIAMEECIGAGIQY